MEKGQRTGQVVFTNKAKCRDCYRCIRVCPVKAIKMVDGQAYVMDERCIQCGTCIRECPQKAKTYISSTEAVKKLLAEKKFVSASIAPSYAAFFSEYEAKRIPSVLRELGFSHVSETAAGALLSAQKSMEAALLKKGSPLIASACPAVINFIEKYRPKALKYLIPVPSPMICHASIIRKLHPESAVVFIGPCVAKKGEAGRSGYEGMVDAVLTFDELKELMNEKHIDLLMREESGFDLDTSSVSRFFPVEGGFLKTASLDETYSSLKTIAVSGHEEVKEVIDLLISSKEQVILEPLFCREGCINGPASSCEDNIYSRKFRLIQHAGNKTEKSSNPDHTDINFIRKVETVPAFFEDRKVAPEVPVTEDDIRVFLEKTGKSNPEDQLNCGSCGYGSCREKAIAVLSGMAEEQMCIPAMRRAAEKKSDKIISCDPNGLVIIDERLNILSMNPAFKKMFMCSDALIGKKIGYLIDPHPFEKLVSGETELIEDKKEYKNYNLICHTTFFHVPGENQYIGIFMNITGYELSEERLEQLKENTLINARELLEHQVKMAENIAKYLGESTARGELLVENMLSLVRKNDQNKEESFWDTFTSK